MRVLETREDRQLLLMEVQPGPEVIQEAPADGNTEGKLFGKYVPGESEIEA